MKVFLFEYATHSGISDPSILIEGLGMFKALYEGFSKFSEVHSSFNHLEKSDYALVIAPEKDYILLNLTKIIEKTGVPNLGSSTKALEITSDKWLLYNKLKGKVNVPKTSLKPLDPPFIVKPRVSCGCEGIMFADSVPEGYIAQQFIKGLDLSVSLLIGDEVRVLSVNKQIIEAFEYKGAIVPFDIEEKEEVINEAIKAVECIKGLFGYVGVDIVLSTDGVPYIIEINARITTPVVLFDDVYGMNLAELLIKNYEGKSIPDFKPLKKGILRKVKGKSCKSYVSYNGYHLVKEILYYNLK